MFGVKGNSVADIIKIDIFTDNNSSTDAVVVADDTSNEIGKQNSGCGSSAACYKGRHAYNSANSDGGVIGPFSGTNFRIFVDLGGTSTIDGSSTLTLGNLVSFKYYSKDGSSITLGGAVDNFTVGYKNNEWFTSQRTENLLGCLRRERGGNLHATIWAGLRHAQWLRPLWGGRRTVRSLIGVFVGGLLNTIVLNSR